jgi:hypothetical protein
VKGISFDPRQTSRVRLQIGPEAQLLSVCGQDAEGELPLASLTVCYEDISMGDSFTDWIVLKGSQKVTIQLTPIWGADGSVEGGRVEVRYVETQPIRLIRWLAQRLRFWLTLPLQPDQASAHWLPPSWSWVGRLSAMVVIIAIMAMVIGYRFYPLPEPPSPPRIGIVRPPEIEPVSPTPAPGPPDSQESASLMARAFWITDQETMVQAIPIERLRSETRPIDLSSREAAVPLSLPIYGPGDQPYTRYRFTLRSGEKPLWPHSLRAPRVVQTRPRHILNVTLFPQRWPRAETHTRQVKRWISPNGASL